MCAHLIIIKYVAFYSCGSHFPLLVTLDRTRKSPPTTSNLRNPRPVIDKLFLEALQEWNHLQSTPILNHPNSWNTCSYLEKLPLL